MGDEESERSVVPMKRENRAAGSRGGKAAPERGTAAGNDAGDRSSENVSTKLQRIARVAREHRDAPLTNLAHYIDLEWLREAYRRTRKTGATGIDRQTAADYGARLEENLRSLLDRAKSGSYWAPPVKRVHIPKGDGQTRPIGIPTFEDKVLQRAVVMVLEAVYEQEFFDCSYGFRRGRSAHQALQATREAVMSMKGAWVVEVDVSKFFDTLDHGHLTAILRSRIRDGVLLRLIGKWLNAGVLDGEQLTRPGMGTPQGGVISPFLANVYLHEVLDTWFAREVEPRLHMQAQLVRYADDFVIVCSCERDAERVMAVLPKRFARYGLDLHPAKTRIVPFARPALHRRKRDREITSSFDLLGFTHYWMRSRKGTWVVTQKTARSRLRRALGAIAEWCREHRHLPILAQRAELAKKMQGHYAYYGITGNARSLSAFFHGVRLLWRLWLDRRSNNSSMTFEHLNLVLEKRPLPKPLLVHKYT
jgi:group II intron reverse transcriptase/maturase